jgi:hypothetical protein
LNVQTGNLLDSGGFSQLFELLFQVHRSRLTKFPETIGVR